MNAIYKRKVYRLSDALDKAVLLNERGGVFKTVEWHEVIADPTDQQLAAAENLGEWVGYDGAELDAYRDMLRGVITIQNFHDVVGKEWR
jgi:hypothetical protein